MDKNIEVILENFDFDKVKRTMEALNWKWRDGVPSTYNLIETAKELLTHLTEDEEITLTGTGGFIATKDSDVLSLYFVIEEASSCDGDLCL